MKNINYIAISLLATSIFAACTNEQPVYESGISSENEILIGKARISDHQTKATSPETSTIATIEDSNMSLTITETVEPMFGNQTKADALDYTGLTDIGVLEDNGFDVYGYYKTTNGSTWNKFIDGKKTTHKDASCYEGADISDYWCFDTPIKWRHSSYHYFWAYAPETNVSNFAGNPVAETATFDYTSDYEHDLVFAHNGMFWDYNKTCAKGAHTGDQLDLVFDHALAGIKVNYLFNVLAAADQEGKTYEPAEDRITINSIDINTKTSGTCTIAKDNTFAWSTEPDLATIVLQKDDQYTENKQQSGDNFQINGHNDEASFIIPQNASGKITLNLFDIKKKLKYPYVINIAEKLSNVFTNAAIGSKTDKKWSAGDMYTYNLTGYIKASYQPQGVDGIKFNFTGKDHRDRLILSGLEGKYMSKIRISWKGIPYGNGSGQNLACVVLVPHQDEWPTISTQDGMNDLHLKPGEILPLFSSGFPELNTASNFPNIVFAIDVEGSSYTYTTYSGRGTVEPGPEKTIESFYNEGFCTTGIIDLPTSFLDEDGKFDLFVAYVGKNNSGVPGWVAKDFTIEVIEYR